MNPNFVVRRLMPADLPAIRALHDRTPPTGQAYTGPQPWPAALDDIPRNFGAFWVAVEGTGKDESVVGMAGLADASRSTGGVPVPDFIDLSRGVVRLDYVRVAPERQRQGIGRALTQTAI